MNVGVVIVGFGNVGRALAVELGSVGSRLGVRVLGALSSRGGVVVRGARDLNALHRLASSGLKLDEHPSFREGMGLGDLLSSTSPNLAFVALPPSYVTGEPNESMFRELVERGVSIVTADKTVLARGFRGFMDYAGRRGVYVGFRATVAAGTPFTDLVRGLKGREVAGFRAILNSTTNYILSLVESGMSFREALGRAVREGYAEPDPSVDVDGWDPAAKLAILASVLGRDVGIHNVERVSLRGVDEGGVRSAVREGCRVRYVAEALIDREVFRVAPLKVCGNSQLLRTPSTHNCIEIYVEGGEVITLSGPAGPAWRTAKVMISDMVEYIERRARFRSNL